MTSAPDGGEWLTSCPGHFTTGKEPQYPLNRRLCGLQSLPKSFEKKAKSICPTGSRTPYRSTHCLVTIPTTLTRPVQQTEQRQPEKKYADIFKTEFKISRLCIAFVTV
jgi:hypothetical protein